MTKRMIISVLCKDRPGIIASITGAVYRLGGDVADLNQTVLCGYLTMILSVSFDSEVTGEDLLAAVSQIKTAFEFEVSIREIDPENHDESTVASEEIYILTVQGPNKAGIVHGISQVCYKRNINIVDLATILKEERYTMALQLDLKKCTCSVETLQKELEEYSRQNNLTAMIQHNDIFQVTNEVSLH